MIEINLIPDVKRELLKAQNTRTAVISVSVLVSLIAGGVVVLLLLYIGSQAIRSAILDNTITDRSAELASVEDLSKTLTIQNQLTKISELNDQKNMNSRVFDVLYAVTPPDPNQVQFSQFLILNEDSTIRLEGQTPTYSSMETFKKTLDSAVLNYVEDGKDKTVKLASEISISDQSYGKDSQDQRVLRFVLTFTYADELFSSNTSSVVAKLSTNGNVTDSYLGVPRSIFTERAEDIVDETE